MRKFGWPLLLIVVLLVGLLGWQAGADQGRNTLTYRPGVTVVTGKQIVGVTGVAIDKLRLFAVSDDGRAAVIPFQIDQRGDDGFYVLPQAAVGGDASHIEHKVQRQDSDGFAVDGNDELAFRPMDAGHKAPAAETFGDAAKVLELELTGGRGLQGWVYLAAYEQNPPPLSDKDYVIYDAQADSVHTANYAALHRPGRADLFLSGLRLSAGDGVEVLDRMKVRLYLKSKVLVSVEVSEGDIKGALAGCIDGPVRVIRRSEHDATVGGIFDTHIEANTAFVADQISLPAGLKLPLSIATVAKEAWVRGGFDLISAGRGMKFYPSRAEPVTVDGRMDEAENDLNRRKPTWLAWSGHGATIYLISDARTNSHAPCTLYYLDDAGADVGPDEEPGAWGQGMYHYDLMAVKRGVFAVSYHMFVLAGEHKKGKEWPPTQVVYQPLRVAVRELPGR